MVARPGLMGLQALRSHVMAELAALAELAARAVILELAELEAMVVPGLAAAVAWAWRALAALVAVAAREETVMMPRRSMTVRLVATAALVALVDRAVQLARLVRTPQR